ncbi:MAG: NAD(P)H-hydrate dehydratase, partial [Alphaproteobacteria bacterium]
IVEDVLKQLKPSVFLNDPKVWQKMFVNFDVDVHKYQKGVCMVVAGEQDYIGASKLASLSAARSGCGMVKLLVNRNDFFLFSTIDPSLIIKSYDNFWGMVSIIGDDKISSFVVGPGLGISDDTRKKVIEVLKTKKPVVIDADAISTFANNPKDLFKHLHQNCVLTPHAGEFHKLFKLEGNKIEQAINAAKQTGTVIVYKGNDTVITDSNKVIINANSSNNLATAGSGDVLSGIIAGLLAQGMTPFYAAAAGVWLHAETARPLKMGMIASDVISHLPKTLNSLVG